MMKIVFFGTPQIAVKTLLALYAEPEIEVVAVVTQPDKPVGKKKVLLDSPVKKTANELNLKVLQPENKMELFHELEKFKDIDFYVVLAYGMIFSQDILDLPKIAPVNIHMSLLPKYRGASPIQSAILDGETQTGVSFMKMDREMDKGDIYLLKRVLIDEKDGLDSLSEKLSGVSASMVSHVLKDVKNGFLSPIPQPEIDVTYCKKIEKEDGRIDFDKSAVEINNMLRAYTPWPGIFFEIDAKKIKIIEMEIDSEETLKSGEFKINGKQLKIGTIKGILLPKTLQVEGKNSMAVSEFLNGYGRLFAQQKD
jgi:methionyl-tRNA formyltransferase